MNQTRRGFSWIEILLSIGIVVFAVSLAMPGHNCKFDRVKHTKAALQRIAWAVNQYYLDNGLIPPSIHALTNNPDGLPTWKGPYLQEASTVDPWGTAFQYRVPGTDEPFEVRSLGSDRAAGGSGDARDLSNWDQD